MEDGIIGRISEIKVGSADIGRLNVKPHQLAFTSAVDAAFDDSAT